MFGFQADYFYALRCVMSNSPAKVFSVLLIFSLFYFAHALRICERYWSNTYADMSYYYNSLWAVILTITTGIASLVLLIVSFYSSLLLLDHFHFLYFLFPSFLFLKLLFHSRIWRLSTQIRSWPCNNILHLHLGCLHCFHDCRDT